MNLFSVSQKKSTQLSALWFSKIVGGPEVGGQSWWSEVGGQKHIKNRR